MVQNQIYLDSPNLGELEKQYLNRCIDSTFVSSHGPLVSEFEMKFSRLLDCRNAVSVQSGSAGLHMALYELGIGKGDEVILPALTFIATANAVKYVGATPVFVDVDPSTWNIDSEKVVKCITSNTKAIIAVHLYGNPCGLSELKEIANNHNLYIVEDAAESLCSKYAGKYTGTFGDFGVFSFNGNKVMTTGSGGMIVGADQSKIDHIKILVNQAKKEDDCFFHTEVGFNFSMTNLQAALGLAQLERLAEFIDKKKRIHKIYARAFKDATTISLQNSYPESETMWWFNSVMIDGASIGLSIPAIQEKLIQKGIPSRRLFRPLVDFPPYAVKDKSVYANAYHIYENGLCLPSSTVNEAEDAERVANVLVDILN